MKHLVILSGVAAVAMGAAMTPEEALAESPLSYSYLEADYVNLDADIYDDEDFLEDIDDGDGWAVQGSLALTPHWFGFAGYSSADSDATFVDDNDVLIVSNQDVKRLNVGLGYNVPVFEGSNMQTDFVARAAYTDVDFDDFNLGGSSDIDIGDLNDDNSDGYFVDAGLRSQLTQRLEGSVGVRYTDIEEVNDTSVIGNLMFEISPTVGLNLAVDAGDRVSTYLLGVRWSFAGY